MAEYLTAAQVADILDYSVDTVRAKFADGSLPAHRVGGGHWRADEAEIRAAIKGQTVKPTTGVDFTAAIRAGLDKAALRVVRRSKALQGTG